MNVWKTLTINQLETITEKRCAVRILEEQIAHIADNLTRICTSNFSHLALVKTSHSPDDRLIDSLALKEEYQITLQNLQIAIRTFELAWSELTRQEQMILDEFYLARNKNAASELSDKLNVDARHVYRLKESALARFALLFYGKELCA